MFKDINISEEQQLYVYEDSAYTKLSAIMRVWKKFLNDQLIAQQKKFNKQISKKWVSIKHEFKFVKKYWIQTAFHLAN